MEKDKKFEEYYKLISNRLKDKVFPAHRIVKDIVKLLFDEKEIRGLNTKEILEILDITKEMILKFKPSIPNNY